MAALDQEIEHNFEWRIINTSELKKFSDKIFKMYDSSYREIGLIDFGGWDGLAGYLNCSCYLLTDDDGDIHGIILYWLAEYGNKISLVISETPEIAKQYVIPQLVKLIQTPGFFVELSDALEYFVNSKYNIPNIRDSELIKLLIPSLKDEDIFSQDDERRKKYPLNDRNKIPSNEGSYLREIKGIGLHRKALYGIPCLNKDFIGDGCNRICNITNKGGVVGVGVDARALLSEAMTKLDVEGGGGVGAPGGGGVGAPGGGGVGAPGADAPGADALRGGGRHRRKSNRKSTRKYKKKSNRKSTRK